MRSILAILLIITPGISLRSNCQNISQIDTKISALMDRITFWADSNYKSYSNEVQDSLSNANYVLMSYLGDVCVRNTSLIKALLPKSEKSGLTDVSSTDGKLRMFSWDSRMGGTMRRYSYAAQYITANGPRFRSMSDTTVEADYGCDYRDIVTVQTKNNKTVYLVFEYAIISTKDRYEAVDAFTIEGTELKKYTIFHTKTRQLSNIGYGYDAFASSNGNDELPSIHFNKDNSRLYIPIVEGEIVTKKYLVYAFDGNYYVFDKNLK